MDRNAHWENVFNTRDTRMVSWYQQTPMLSYELIKKANVNRNHPIIEVGGGDSTLADKLLLSGFIDVTVLDISQTAMGRVKERVGDTEKITVLISDILDMKDPKVYALWHDRAVFHFMTTDKEKQKYKQVLLDHLVPHGTAIIATFAKNGPDQCSNLPVSQYNKDEFEELFAPELRVVDYFEEVHITPKGVEQNFAWVQLKRHE